MNPKSQIVLRLFCEELTRARRQLQCLRKLRGKDAEGDLLLRSAVDHLAGGNTGGACAEFERFELIASTLSCEERAVLHSIRDELAKCQVTLGMLGKGTLAVLKCLWSVIVCCWTANPLNYQLTRRRIRVEYCVAQAQ